MRQSSWRYLIREFQLVTFCEMSLIKPKAIFPALQTASINCCLIMSNASLCDASAQYCSRIYGDLRKILSYLGKESFIINRLYPQTKTSNYSWLQYHSKEMPQEDVDNLTVLPKASGPSLSSYSLLKLLWYYHALSWSTGNDQSRNRGVTHGWHVCTKLSGVIKHQWRLFGCPRTGIFAG